MKTMYHRICIIGWLAFALVVATRPAIAGPSLNNPNLTRVTDGVYALVGAMAVPDPKNHGFICNTTFIVTQSGVMMGIDHMGNRLVGHLAYFLQHHPADLQ